MKQTKEEITSDTWSSCCYFVCQIYTHFYFVGPTAVCFLLLGNAACCWCGCCSVLLTAWCWQRDASQLACTVGGISVTSQDSAVTSCSHTAPLTSLHHREHQGLHSSWPQQPHTGFLCVCLCVCLLFSSVCGYVYDVSKCICTSKCLSMCAYPSVRVCVCVCVSCWGRFVCVMLRLVYLWLGWCAFSMNKAEGK